MDKIVSITWWRGIFVRYGQGLAVLMCIVMVIGFGWNQFGSSHNSGGSQNNPDQTIVKVNGQPITQMEFARARQSIRDNTAKPGSQFAALQGQILRELVQNAVLEQMAKRRGVHTTAAEVDQQIDRMREQAGMKKSSDTEWENFVQQHTGISLSEFRDQIANSPALLGNALLQSYKADQKVSDTDVRNQNQQVKLAVVLIPTGNSPFMPAPRGQKPLTDAEAKQKAEALLAKVKGGADFAAIAKANSGDPSASKGGDLGFRSEYKSPGGPMAMFGVLGYGKEFDDTVHKTATGQLTPVVKATGFAQGYVFAKVVDRKTDTPKDFNPKKAIEDLKTAQASQKLDDDLRAQIKGVKLEWSDPDMKTYYDQDRLSQIPREQMQAQLSGKAIDPADRDLMTRQQELVDKEWEDALKRHPDDTTAALMVADGIKQRKRYARGSTPAQNDQYRDRLIQLYTLVLKTNEDRDLRFSLADLLTDKKDYAAAGEQYNQIAKYMGQDPPYNAETMQNYQVYYQRLAAGYTKIGQPAEAVKMQQMADDLKPKIAAAKAAEERARQAQSAQIPPTGIGSGASFPPAPTGAPKPPTGVPAAPTGAPKPPVKP